MAGSHSWTVSQVAKRKQAKVGESWRKVRYWQSGDSRQWALHSSRVKVLSMMPLMPSAQATPSLEQVTGDSAS